MILRFSYDLEGKGLEKEPGSIRLVEEHMQQIGEVIREYADDIFAVQGILIGNWGEMHGSRYLTPDAFRTLTDTMIKAVDGACPVAVRKPAQWRELTLGWTEQEKKKLTLFTNEAFRKLDEESQSSMAKITGNTGTENLQPGRRTGMAEKRNVRKILRRRGHMGKWGRTGSFRLGPKSNGGSRKNAYFLSEQYV